VLLVDDNPDFLRAAERVVAGQPGVEVIGVAWSGAEALAKVTALRPDVVLMDVVMPVMSGFEATRRIKQARDAPFVIIVTMHDGPEHMEAARAAGADGFVTKPDLYALLPDLIRRVSTAPPPGEKGGSAVSDPRTAGELE
jgi:CheY-like chemotaxis protein